jgi:Uma2 family endonuclease
MLMASASTRWTAAQIRELPDDGQRYEVVDGSLLVTPAPSWKHQDAVMTLWHLLQAYLRPRNIGHPIVAPADVEFAADRLVEPDLFVVPLINGRNHARGRIASNCCWRSKFCHPPRLVPIAT